MAGGKIPQHIANEAAAQAVRDARLRANQYPPVEVEVLGVSQRLDRLEAAFRRLENLVRALDNSG